MSESIHPRLQEFLSDAAEQYPGVSEKMARERIEAGIGVNLAEVSDENAVRFADAWESGDVDELDAVLADEGVSEEDREQVVGMIEEVHENPEEAAEKIEEETGVDPRENGTDTDESGNASNSGGQSVEVDPQQLQQIVADGVVQGLQQATGGGGGGAQAPPQQATGGDNPSGGGGQGQQMLLQLLTSHLAEPSGGGPMSEMGEKATEKVMERSMMRLARPSFGEIIGEAIEKNAAKQIAEKYAGDIDVDDMSFGDEGEVDEPDDDGDDSSGWSIL